MAEDTPDVLVLTGEIVAAYVSHNSLRPESLPELIRTIRATLVEQAAPQPEPASEPEQIKLTPGQIRKSIRPDALISFVDGKPYKTLKRHLSRNGMTIEEYRAKYGLPRDYPSVAPDYSARRSEMARALGLGARGRGSQQAAAPTPSEPAKRGRPRKATPQASQGEAAPQS